MSGNIHGLSWFPNIPDKFVTWGGQAINLYEVRNKTETEVNSEYRCQLKLKAAPLIMFP